MGFYGTLKLIFYKVSIDYRHGMIDQLYRGLSSSGEHWDDKAFLTAECLWGACT